MRFRRRNTGGIAPNNPVRCHDNPLIFSSPLRIRNRRDWRSRHDSGAIRTCVWCPVTGCGRCNFARVLRLDEDSSGPVFRGPCPGREKDGHKEKARQVPQDWLAEQKAIWEAEAEYFSLVYGTPKIAQNDPLEVGLLRRFFNQAREFAEPVSAAGVRFSAGERSALEAMPAPSHFTPQEWRDLVTRIDLMLQLEVVNSGAMTIAAGKVTVGKDFQQTSSGVLSVGLGAQQRGALETSFGVTLAGKLEIETAADFDPDVGETVALINAGERNGEFGEVEGLDIGGGKSLRLNYTPTGVELEVVATQ